MVTTVVQIIEKFEGFSSEAESIIQELIDRFQVTFVDSRLGSLFEIKTRILSNLHSLREILCVKMESSFKSSNLVQIESNESDVEEDTDGTVLVRSKVSSDPKKKPKISPQTHALRQLHENPNESGVREAKSKKRGRPKSKTAQESSLEPMEVPPIASAEAMFEVPLKRRKTNPVCDEEFSSPSVEVKLAQRRRWTAEEDEVIQEYINQKNVDWMAVGERVNRSAIACQSRFRVWKTAGTRLDITNTNK